MGGIVLITIIAVAIFITVIALLSRYKRCPSDKILVIYGKTGKSREGVARSARCIHGGAAFVCPIIQSYEFLDLTPMSIEVNLTNALSKQHIRVDVPSRFTVGISVEEGIMTNAAERLLGLKTSQIQDLAKDIIFGQLRLVIATMDIEEINSDRDKFLANVTSNVEAELKKIGLKLINVNITDINDESGYIEALGKEAAAKAINDAKKSVAEKNRDGAIGEAEAKREERIRVSEANSKAVEGENIAKITVANSEAERRLKQAEAERKAVAAEKVQAAKALEEAYAAEMESEKARAERERATKYADVVVHAEIEKQRVEIEAEAEAEKIRRHAKGEADAILAKMEAEAKGAMEILSKQAEGFEKLVKAAGNNSKDAVMLMIADKLPEIAKIQAEAIKNIKFDKITVWDTMGGKGDGTSSTANFLSGMMKTIPPMEDVFKMTGMELPNYFKGKVDNNEKEEYNEVKVASVVEDDVKDNK
ncbi:inner membrane protein YqiK [Clostridium tepidiprofundi DSM 19306]|uniref:Inner membrane protein YqiK n=1 Tax=Clostridium tepidiprofundi DSM 19306 TaxID=1121338 RepID=A0A151B4L6_9CLOT|nr:flotillin family protein [Clostridium tepidiprofundi]KYH34849.1 inner membrane protein YqiK [Clostridium tepidiprofundi DSM 19306]